MFSFKAKKSTPGSRAPTPNAAQPELVHSKNSSTSLLEKVRKKRLLASITDQDRSVLNAVASVHLGSIDAFVPQDNQGSAALAFTIVESNDKSVLPMRNQPQPVAPRSLKIEKKVLPALPSSTQQPWSNIFSQNVAPPTLSTSFPPPGVRFENTAQLAYCGNLLRKSLSPFSGAACTSDEPLDPIQRALIEPYAQSEDEANQVRWLIQRVVEEFAADSLKTTAVLSEVLLLASSLDQECYRKLLNCVITQFETAILVDIDLLLGVVYLVESASSDYLEPDDLVRILTVLRIRLQETHSQSTKHPYYLTLALSRLLDVMVDGKVKDLQRVVEQEPLSALFNQLKDSTDPYLKHQAIYAFQGLLHVPNDETRRQFMLRHAGNITMGLLGVASVCKLDLGQLKDGADHLYKAAGDAHEVGTKIVGGMRTLFESGQGIWASVRGGIFSGGRHLWYSTLREAEEHIRYGRLQNFNRLVLEAPCHAHIEFQWRICQLLGEIAVDTRWEIATRHHAVNFLAEFYRNDSIRTPYMDIDRWVLNILRQFMASLDASISDHTKLVLHGLEKAGDASKQELYRDTLTASLPPHPIKAHQSIPSSSELLARVQAIPAIDYDLQRLKDRILEKQDNALYIPPQAKSNLQSPDSALFPLMEKALGFLTGPGMVFLLLGDSGGGKSTFNLQLERTLWKTYKRGDPIPLHINLPSINNPQQDMIGEQLRRLNFSDTQIMELKQNRRLIVICDGYDESQQVVNLHHTNMLNQPGQWDTKIIISCRTQYLGPNYHSRFVPQGSGAYDRSAQNLFQEAVIAPFTKEQIQRYVDIYVPLEPRTWRTQDYMDRLTTIPNLLDLVKNPFLLSLALEALPGLTDGQKNLSTIKISRVQLYDTFVRHWLEVNQRRLERKALSKEDRYTLNHMVEDDFVSLGIDYSERLSAAIFEKQDGNPIVQYTHRQDKNSWKAVFFGVDSEVKFLCESSPLIRIGNQYRFVHRSMLEYFLSHAIYSQVRIEKQEFDLQAGPVFTATPSIVTNGPLFRQDLMQEPSIIQFLCDRVKLNPDFEQQLRGIVDLSKTDASAITAATNAITILVRASAHFNGADLRGVKIPGADLSGGQFDSAQFQGADLRDANLAKSWMRQANLSGARLEGVRFGELQYLVTATKVKTCAFSPDGRMLAVGLEHGGFRIFDTSTWTVIQRFLTDDLVQDIAFSPDSQQIVSAENKGSVRTWDCTSGKNLLFMSRNKDCVNSVAFSPCGKQIASAGDDCKIRLWDSRTGMSEFVLARHTKRILSVKYSPNGRQLASGSEDGTIRFWNPQMGKSDAPLLRSKVRRLAYSPDGRLLACGHGKDGLKLWNTATREFGPVLRGHSASVTGVTFSPNGQWIASSSWDNTVRLWDASTGSVVFVLTDQGTRVECVAFSPDGLQIASGGNDEKVRLWEVGSTWPSPDLRGRGRVLKVTYTLDGLTILTQVSPRLFQKLRAGTGASESIPFSPPKQKLVSRSVFTVDDCQFAAGYKDGPIYPLNRQISTARPIVKGYFGAVRKLVYSPCYRWIVLVDNYKTVRLWDLHNSEQDRVLVKVDKVLEGAICAVAFSAAGDQLAVCAGRRTVYHFDIPTTERLTYNKLTVSNLFSMVYAPNGGQIAIGTGSGCIHFWDLQSKEPSVKLQGHKGQIRCIAYSPCGQWIASGSLDETVGIWHRQLLGEVESWSKANSICSFYAAVDNVAWNPVVPMELVTGSKDRSVRVWRVSHDDGGNVLVKMLWGSNLGMLHVKSLVLENTIDLSSVNRELLIQRGAISPSDLPKGQ
ncbi:hypothetical protein BGX24_002406 [Mortierella sp. AD032]|nr:hypothetical protein BGX24_002406 [Mortierella sp. AD032]